MKKRAFSLTQLLVVIAIISILATIMVPHFLSSREEGVQTQCLSNLQQLFKASMLYMADNDNHLPARDPRQTLTYHSGAAPFVERDPLARYGMTRELYFCADGRADWGHRKNPDLSDYTTRFDLMRRSSGPGGIATCTFFRIEPQPSSVLAYDPNHGLSDMWLLLRGDGSVKWSAASQPKQMYWQEGKWTSEAPTGIAKGFSAFTIFPGEPHLPILTVMEGGG